MPGKVRREFLFGVAPCLAALRAERRKIYKMYLNDKFQNQEPNRWEQSNNTFVINWILIQDKSIIKLIAGYTSEEVTEKHHSDVMSIYAKYFSQMKGCKSRTQISLKCSDYIQLNWFRNSLIFYWSRKKADFVICDALHDLVTLVQFKKTWKPPMEECYFS